MTKAVCLKCGELKFGAFLPCPQCRYRPDDDESLTKHLLVTDHYHSHETLETIAARVKAGKPIEFDPESLKAAWVTKSQLDAETKRLGRGCLAWALIAAAIVLGLVLYFAS